MTLLPTRDFWMAVGLGLLMHSLLFVAAKPSNGAARSPDWKPPRTDYAFMNGMDDVDAVAVRTVNSPVLFSLPLDVGFSGELQHHDVQNQKVFSPLPVQAEHFLDIDSVSAQAVGRLRSDDLMISARVRPPRLPDDAAAAEQSQIQTRRVMLPPDIRNRLIGSIVLPPALNQPSETPWTARASVSISEQGVVEHVFLEQPLESSVMNQQVLQLIYSLRFKAGIAAESIVEIYSPEADKNRGAGE